MATIFRDRLPAVPTADAQAAAHGSAGQNAPGRNATDPSTADQDAASGTTPINRTPRKPAFREHASGKPAFREAAFRAHRPRTSPTRSSAAVVHLIVLGTILAAAVFAAGGTIPAVWTACQCASGLLLLSWAVAANRSPTLSAEDFPLAALALPLYAIAQTIPLPLEIVRRLSPARAEIHDSVLGLAPHLPSWTPLSVHPQETLDFALRLAAYAAVYWIARGLARRLARYGFAAAAPLVVVAAAQAAIALQQQFAAEPARGSYVNRNHLAGLLEMALPFALVPAMSLLPAWARRPSVAGGRTAAGRLHISARNNATGLPFATLARGALSVAAALLIFAAILATRSRGGLVAALFSLLLSGLIAVRHAAGSHKKWLLAAALPALLAAVFLYLPSDNLVRRYTHLFGGEALRGEGRLLLWRETLDLVAAYPWTGCGFGGYQEAFLRYKRSAPMVNDPHAHNDYLELLAEAGACGLLVCLLWAAPPIATAVRASLSREPSRNRPLALACTAALAAILAHSLVDFNLRIPANGLAFVWILGIGSACGRYPRTHRRNSRQEPKGRDAFIAHGFPPNGGSSPTPPSPPNPEKP